MSKLTDFKPQRKNSNKHTPRGLSALEQSIQADGWIGAITVAADGETFDGSARIEVGAATGFEDAIVVESDGTRPIVHVRKDIPTADDPRARRLGHAANRVAQMNLDFDPAVILADIEAGVNLDALWRPDELEALVAAASVPTAAGEDKGAQVDRAAELQAQWGTALGQVWELGEHRLAVGDCTDRAVVETLGPIDAVFTDPPYGINVDTGWLSALHVQRGKPANKSDDKLAGDDGTLDLSFLWDYRRRMVWGFPYVFDPYATGWVVWDKQPGVEGRGIVTPIEMASTTMRKGFDMVRCMWGGYYRAAGEKRFEHPTQKPMGVVEPFISSWTAEGETIADFFLGSGTTLIACEKLRRKCRAIELDEGYAAVTLQRWADMTGKTPRLLT